jgi:hypothetical protein
MVMTPAQSFACINSLCKILEDNNFKDIRECRNTTPAILGHVKRILQHPDVTQHDIDKCVKIMNGIENILKKEKKHLDNLRRKKSS